MRWREIRDLNVGRTLDDGSVITDATLYSGWKLLLPHDATVDADTACANGNARAERLGA
ncbi:MAG: hypothetical protein V9F00_08060 [Nocardioides sp.]